MTDCPITDAEHENSSRFDIRFDDTAARFRHQLKAIAAICAEAEPTAEGEGK